MIEELGVVSPANLFLQEQTGIYFTFGDWDLTQAFRHYIRVAEQD